jgi:hypothetical protein
MALAKLSKTQNILIPKVKKNKVMLVTFFDSHRILHKEFALPDQTMNMEYHAEVPSLLFFSKNFLAKSCFRKEEAGSSCTTV